MASNFTLLGITDECTSCDCCGKSGLKCTMALVDGNGAQVYYGRDCGARALGWKVSADRAEGLVKGTARVDGQIVYFAWQSAYMGMVPATPPTTEVDGVKIEVWYSHNGSNLPAGRPWVKSPGFARRGAYYWRAVA